MITNDPVAPEFDKPCWLAQVSDNGITIWAKLFPPDQFSQAVQWLQTDTPTPRLTYGVRSYYTQYPPA